MKYRGTDIGSGTNTWSMSEDVRAGKMTTDEFHEAESVCTGLDGAPVCSNGICPTMASMVESLGAALPGNAAFCSGRASKCPRARIGTSYRADGKGRESRPSTKSRTRQAFENAIRTNAAIGGLTNAVIHPYCCDCAPHWAKLSIDDWDNGRAHAVESDAQRHAPEEDFVTRADCRSFCAPPGRNRGY